MRPESLSIQQLQSALQHCAKMTRERMAPLLYYLRLKLLKQGSRTGGGFGPWCEEHLSITRRTADTWANEWAVAHGKPTSRNISKSPVPKSRAEDDLYSIEFNFQPDKLREFQQAYRSLPKKEAQEVIYEAVIKAAKKKKPQARGAAAGR